MKSLFLTGTDTSVGKTFICSFLLDYCIRHGINTGYQKWVSTGDTGRAADLLFCEQAVDLPAIEEALQVPYSFSYPASPHLAAEIDGKTIDSAKILTAYNTLRKHHDLLIVEGAGGVLVPLRRDLLLADLIAKASIPTLIVARSGLGTINHSLLTIEALRQRSIPITGIIFTDSTDDTDENLVADNMKIVAELGNVHVFGRMKYLPEPLSTARARILFEPIGNALSNHI